MSRIYQVYNERHELIQQLSRTTLLTWDDLREAIGISNVHWYGGGVHPKSSWYAAAKNASSLAHWFLGSGVYGGVGYYWIEVNDITKGWPPRSPPKTIVSLPDGVDKATAALVASSIPAYRNSDCCPVPGCTRQMYFKQCYLVCDVHGYTDTRTTKRAG